MNKHILLIIFSINACVCIIFAINAYFSILPSTTVRSVPDSSLPIRAVNLGGWLVIERWIKPSLFDGIPNKFLLDGTRLNFKSVTVGKYLCAERGGGTILVANRTSASTWETFILWRINETTFNFRLFNRQFVGLNGVDIVATAGTPALTETFQILRNPDDPNRVRIKAPNGFFIQVKTGELVTADYEGNGGWGDDNPSVFVMNMTGGLYGEYQMTNGYGPVVAPRVMKEHWDTYIVEEDFKHIKKNGLNAVRIPIGWWIASDPNPPKPYVGGSLQALDRAFSWAEKYGLQVILDLHAAPGSQNGWEHSSSRDGSQEWGNTDENIQQTVDVIEFVTARYAKSPNLHAVGLINEPLAPGVSLETITKYYRGGYEAVRRHSTTAYVVMSNRVEGSQQPTELFDLANGFTNVVIDVHYYNMYSIFRQFNVQQHIDYVYTNRTQQLSELTTSNGPLILIGEWAAVWQVEDATKEDYKRYAAAQLQVFQKATFGWAYWSWRCKYNPWNLEWMINNGWIKL